MGREAWWATVHVVTKESDTTERLSIHTNILKMNSDKLQSLKLFPIVHCSEILLMPRYDPR